MLWKGCTQYASKLENSAVNTELKTSDFIPTPKENNAKECSNYYTVVLISHVRNIMLEILYARLQHHMNWQIPDVQVRFRKGGRTRDQAANIHWIIENAK